MWDGIEPVSHCVMAITAETASSLQLCFTNSPLFPVKEL